MAKSLVIEKIRFSDDKEVNTWGFAGSGYEIEYPNNLDITLGSSMFPLRIDSLPYDWSANDVSGITWSIHLETSGSHIAGTFSYGGSTTQFDVNIPHSFPMFLLPRVDFITSDGVVNTVDVQMFIYDAGCYSNAGSGIYGSFHNGVAYTRLGVMSLSDALQLYQTSSDLYYLSVVDITDSGGVRYIFRYKTGFTATTNFIGRRYPVGEFTQRSPSSAFTYEGYVSPYDISTGRLELSPTTFYYDGNEHLPTATLYDAQGNILLYGTDWGISYSPDRTNPGQKIALAYGQGAYTGEITANWWILDANDISGYTMNIVPRNMRYTGEEQIPLVTIYSRDGTLLVQNVDYTLVLGPNTISVGLKYARATGIGDYTGTLEGEWEIFDAAINPYMPGGETVPSTGPTDGNWALPEDELAPSGSIFSDLDAQLYRPYAMTAAQVASFSNQLWNTSILDVISRYFEKPTDVVISLMSYPFEVQSTETASQIAFNWISEWSSVYVTGYSITQELQTLDFGYIDIERYSGTFYDYQPYSTIQLYLPYIGFVPLKMNEVLGRRVYLKYIVDVITGDFSAIIETSWPSGSSSDETTIPIIATYQGNIAKPLPLSQQDMFTLYKKGAEIAVTSAVAATAGIAGYMGAEEAMAASAKAQSLKESGLLISADMQGRIARTAAEQSKSMMMVARRSAAGTVINAMYAVGHNNTPIIRNGNLDGIAGRTSMHEAFVIISVPDQNVPGNQGILGYPTNLPGPLENYAGYTEVRDIRIKSATATESELAEIEEIVRGGIII